MTEKRKPAPIGAQDATQQARKHAGLAIRTLAGIARDAKAPATARVAAASKLLERGFGRAIGGDTGGDTGPDALDDETLRRLLDQHDGRE